MPTEWWLRPVSSAWRVGEQSAVVWNRLYFSPPAASRSNVGVAIGPPNALDDAKPASSISTTSTFGAPAGGRSGSIGGNAVAGSFASYVVTPTYCGSGIGSTPRSFAILSLLRSLSDAPILDPGDARRHHPGRRSGRSTVSHQPRRGTCA